MRLHVDHTFRTDGHSKKKGKGHQRMQRGREQQRGRKFQIDQRGWRVIPTYHKNKMFLHQIKFQQKTRDFQQKVQRLGALSAKEKELEAKRQIQSHSFLAVC